MMMTMCAPVGAHETETLSDDCAFEASEMLARLGAKKETRGRYTWALRTRAGVLRVQVVPTTTCMGVRLLMRFDEPRRAVEVIGLGDRGMALLRDLDPESGRWNHFLEGDEDAVASATKKIVEKIL